MKNRLFKTFKGRLNFIAGMAITAIFIFSTQSCKNQNELPAGVLSQEQMVSVLREMYLTEEKVNRLNLVGDSSTHVFDIMKEKVFEKTGVEDSVFRNSFDYYMDNPKDLELIYTALVDSLQLMEQRVPMTRSH
jgi:hypothetical protein